MSAEASFRVELQGELDTDSALWLGGYKAIVSIEHELGLTTLLTSPLDSPALYGLLQRIRNLNVDLISLQRL